MPKAARLGDVGSGHGCFPPSNATVGSPDVSINGKAAVRVSDPYAAHGCGNCSPHGRALAAGSATVSINGLAAGRVGDAIDCGGAAATGSPNVFIGDVGMGLQAWTCMQKAKQAMEAFMTSKPSFNKILQVKVLNDIDEPYQSGTKLILITAEGVTRRSVVNDEGIALFENIAAGEFTVEVEKFKHETINMQQTI